MTTVTVGAPSFKHVPARDGSFLDTVVGVLAQVGRVLDPAQRETVDVLTSSWEDGRPAVLEAAVVCPRQNLKTFCLEAIALTRLLMPEGAGLVVWSAHEVATAQETFQAFLELADQHAWLARRVVHVSRATGREGITFEGPAGDQRRLRFRARVKTGGRGLAGDLIVLDEAFALLPEHMGSLLPILSTRPRGQVLYGSSAPQAGSDVLRGVISRGRAGGPGAPAYLEWAAPGSLADSGCGPGCVHHPGTPGCVLDDEGLWLAANPAAVFGRISLEYLRAERLALAPAEFARERLGWADSGEAGGRRRIGAGQWAAAAVPVTENVMAAPMFGVAVSFDRAWSSVGVAHEVAGLPQLELARYGRGTRWLVDAVLELRVAWPSARFGIIPSTAAASVAGELEQAGVEVVRLSAGEVTAACGLLVDEVTAVPPQVRHVGDQILGAAVENAETRGRGDGGFTWWASDSAVDISPLVAVTVARSLLPDGYDLLDSVL